MITVGSLDLGTSGKSAICIVQGEKFKVKCIYLEAIQSISAPDLEVVLDQAHARFQPQIWLMEMNGPGAIFEAYLQKNKPHIPMATVDTSLPLPEEYTIPLWEDFEVNHKLVLNVRAAMYWILRLFYRDQRSKIYKDDEELFAQLSVLRWDNDNARGDKIYMISKRKLRFATSDLDEEPFSKSPDKADALALAHFAYCLMEQQNVEGVETEEQHDEVVEPPADGFFPVVGFEEEEGEMSYDPPGLN